MPTILLLAPWIFRPSYGPAYADKKGCRNRVSGEAGADPDSNWGEADLGHPLLLAPSTFFCLPASRITDIYLGI